MRMLQTHALTIFSLIVFILMSFRRSSTVRTDTICMRFVLIHFQERFQIGAFLMNTQRISVDGRPKRIEMYALMWTGPQTSVMYPCLKISYCW